MQNSEQAVNAERGTMHAARIDPPTWDQAIGRAARAGEWLAGQSVPVQVPLSACVGEVPAESVLVTAPVPHYDSSAMDGYAVAGVPPWRLVEREEFEALARLAGGGEGGALGAGADTQSGDTGADLPEAAASDPSRSGMATWDSGVTAPVSGVTAPVSGIATPVLTGSLIPAGTVSVVRQEFTRSAGGAVELSAAGTADAAAGNAAELNAGGVAGVKAGDAAGLNAGDAAAAPFAPGESSPARGESAPRSFGTDHPGLLPSYSDPTHRDLAPDRNIRRAGREAKPGDLIAAAGTPMSPAQVAFAAVTGLDQIAIRPRLRVGLLFTGDEVRTSGVPAPGTVRDAFGPQLPAYIEQLGGRVAAVRRVGDDKEQTKQAVGELVSAGAQLIVSTGGSGHSQADIVRALAEEMRIANMPDRPAETNVPLNGPVAFPADAEARPATPKVSGGGARNLERVGSPERVGELVPAGSGGSEAPAGVRGPDAPVDLRGELVPAAEFEFPEIAMRPGHPTFLYACSYGALASATGNASPNHHNEPANTAALTNHPQPILHLGLPGNPLAAMVAVRIALAALLRAARGMPTEPIPTQPVGEEIAGGTSARVLPATRQADGTWVSTGAHGSNMLRGLAQAEALLVVPAHGCVRGDRLPVLGLG